jgi:deazaflavin-dependent oxidoreductase (nitroreductase family)
MAADKREMGPVMRRFVRLGSSPAASWWFLNVANPIDKRLIPATNGRLSMVPGMPVLVMEVRGAKSGAVRRVPLVYGTDGDDVVLIASNGGNPRHPAWFHNVRANPDVKLYLRGRSGRYRARIAEGEERERLWKVATTLNPGYDIYKVRASNRRIPVVALSPAPDSP